MSVKPVPKTGAQDGTPLRAPQEKISGCEKFFRAFCGCCFTTRAAPRQRTVQSEAPAAASSEAASASAFATKAIATSSDNDGQSSGLPLSGSVSTNAVNLHLPVPASASLTPSDPPVALVVAEPAAPVPEPVVEPPAEAAPLPPPESQPVVSQALPTLRDVGIGISSAMQTKVDQAVGQRVRSGSHSSDEGEVEQWM